MVKNWPANAGDVGSIPESGRSLGEGDGSPLQYSCLGNPMDRGTWWAIVHRVTKSWTRLSNCVCSVMFDSFVSPWTIAHQVPLSMEFSRQENWSGLPFPSPGDLPNTGIEPRSPALQADCLLTEPQGKLPLDCLICLLRNLYAGQEASVRTGHGTTH